MSFRLLLLLGLGVALGPLAGCAEADGDEVVLEFWAMGAEGEKVQPLIERFEEDIQFIEEWVGRSRPSWRAVHPTEAAGESPQASSKATR